MASHTHANGDRPALSAPVRNRYFYGKLLDVPHLELEQRYFIERRRLLNRLTLGFGVVCGLDVRLTDEGTVVVEPGVAIDGLGREIVVDRVVPVEDPFALTDPCGEATGEVSETGPVVLCLGYHECRTDPVPVLVADCEVRERCEPGAVRERFRLFVTEPDQAHRPEGPTRAECRALFGPRAPREPSALREHLCQVLSGPCAEPRDACVPLALLERNEGGVIEVDTCGVRTNVYSNAALLDIVLCLAERVEECCRGRPGTGPPVVNALFPAPGATVQLGQVPPVLGAPTALLAVTFDRAMSTARLGAPDPWLGVWLLVPGTEKGEVHITRVPLTLDHTTDQPLAGVVGFSAIYRIRGGQRAMENVSHRIADLEAGPAGDGDQVFTARVVVQIRADDRDAYAVDESTPAQLLDADFGGTGLPQGTLDKFWAIDTTGSVRDIWEQVRGGAGTLPSGDGDEGGLLHSYFEVTT